MLEAFQPGPLRTLTRRRFLNGCVMMLGCSAVPGQLVGLRALADQPKIIKLTKDYGYEKFRVSRLPEGALVDATEASWIVQNSRSEPDTVGCDTGDGPTNRYPFQIYHSPYPKAIGGVIRGEVPQEADWRNTYYDVNDGSSCNSAAVHFNYCEGAIAEGWRIDKCWDGIRIGYECDGFLIERCHLSDVRDDAVDNPRRSGGTIRDCLLDGVFVGIAVAADGPTDASKKELLVDGVLMRMKPYWYKGRLTHGTPFKTQSDVDAMPAIRLRNNVIAITDAGHIGRERMKWAWDRTVESANNYFLNLTDDPLPDNYPRTFPALGGRDWAGFVLLEGQSARDYWERVRQERLAALREDSSRRVRR